MSNRSLHKAAFLFQHLLTAVLFINISKAIKNPANVAKKILEKSKSRNKQKPRQEKEADLWAFKK